MKISGLVILFEGAAVRAYPLTNGGDGADELVERLPEFCRLVLSSPDLLCCIAGLHDHAPGRCARR